MLKTKLYNGTIEVQFDELRHKYYVNGKRRPGVTTYCGVIDKSKALVPWAVKKAVEYIRVHLEDLKKCKILIEEFNQNEILYGAKNEADREKNVAAEIGKAIHKWVEDYANKKKPEMPEDKKILNGVNAFLDWIKEEKFKIKHSEMIVYSKKYDFVGTQDMELEKNGKFYLGDIKTGKGIYNEMRLQTAAYMEARQEESKKKYDGRFLIQLNKETGEFFPYFLDYQKGEYERDFKAFIHCKAIYDWQKIVKLSS